MVTTSRITSLNLWLTLPQSTNLDQRHKTLASFFSLYGALIGGISVFPLIKIYMVCQVHELHILILFHDAFHGFYIGLLYINKIIIISFKKNHITMCVNYGFGTSCLFR